LNRNPAKFCVESPLTITGTTYVQEKIAVTGRAAKKTPKKKEKKKEALVRIRKKSASVRVRKVSKSAPSPSKNLLKRRNMSYLFC
jgi:hypothetical protein